jgi:CMP-N,N'-diacetyllegionaminic acid synthase
MRPRSAQNSPASPETKEFAGRSESMLAVIPARGGSKGLPRKNVLCLAGLPLIAHSIRFAQSCQGLTNCVVSTEDEEIAAVARAYGGKVPFMRPSELARDDSPTLPALQHAVREVERIEGTYYSMILALQPTTPVRRPEHLQQALELLREDSEAAGVVAVSQPSFNPRYVCVEEESGYLKFAFRNLGTLRRQDFAPLYRITGSLYLWRRDFLLNARDVFAPDVRYRMLEVDDSSAIDIDDEKDLKLADLLITSGAIALPWALPSKGDRSISADGAES